MLIKLNSALISPMDSTEISIFDTNNRSKSLASLSRSPTYSITSSNSSANIKSCFSTSSSQRRFHSSQLGRPPGVTSNQTIKKASSQIIQPKVNNIKSPAKPVPPKVAPLKEIEKMIDDLKKENFDLKLKLYHMEELLSKDLNMYQLNEENYRLRVGLEDKNRHIEALEQELIQLADRKPRIISRGTQTTTFESSPEAFNLLPAPSRQEQSWRAIVANEDHLSSVVNALQEIKIDTHVESWLNQTVSDHQQGKLRRPCL